MRSTTSAGLMLPFEIIYLHQIRGFPTATSGLVLATITGTAALVTAPTGALLDHFRPRLSHKPGERAIRCIEVITHRARHGAAVRTLAIYPPEMGGESPKSAWSGHEFGHSQSRPCEPTTTPVICATASPQADPDRGQPCERAPPAESAGSSPTFTRSLFRALLPRSWTAWRSSRSCATSRCPSTSSQPARRARSTPRPSARWFPCRASRP